MAKSKAYIVQSDLKNFYSKMDSVESFNKMIHEDLKSVVEKSRDKAKSDFRPSSHDPVGLSRLISSRSLSRKKSLTIRELSMGADKNPIMAYIEFGTRSKNGSIGNLDFRGITKIFGTKAKAWVAEFKINSGRYTDRKAKPYFFSNIHREYEAYMKKVNKSFANLFKKGNA